MTAVPGFDALTPLCTGQLLSGRYRLVRPIARGGMADVWQGHDEILSRDVAVKVLQDRYATDAAFLERFRREAVAAARLAHPGVVATFDAGADGATTYIVMELVRGTTLRQYLAERGPLSPALALGITAQIADALAVAHRAGIIHRDIKPANVLLCDDGGKLPRAKVTDFGIAKAAEGLGSDLTRTGTVLGTPRYLSPEQVEGAQPDARTDLYALGVVTFEMLTGRSPFEGDSEMALAMARVSRSAPRVRELRPEVPRAVDDLVAELLATSPERRVPTAADLRLDLEALLVSLRASGSGRPAHRPAHRPAPRRHRPVPRRPAGDDDTSPSRPPRWRVPRARSGAGGRPAGKARRSPSRAPGVVVGALALAAVAIGALLLEGGHRPSPPGTATPPAQAATPVGIGSVSVWIVPPMKNPDNPDQVGRTFDGNPQTTWSSAVYTRADFGGWGGEGLAVHLTRRARVTELVVTSPTVGWAASTYVSDTEPTTLAGWGPATATQPDVAGSTTFDLAGRTGSWVMLWMTNTGPALSVQVGQLRVS